MKHTTYALMIFFISTFISCSSDKKQGNEFDLEQLYIDLSDKNTGTYDISNDIFQEFEFIRLETTDSCLIGRVDKILFENNSYYILDNMSHAIYCFSSLGKHLLTLDHFGQGPDEYLDIHEFVVENDNIWICDNTSQRVLCYDKSQNVIDLIDLKKHNFWVEEMICKNGYIYLVNNWLGTDTKNYQVCIYDLKSKKALYEKEFPPLENVIYRGISHQIASADSSCLVTFSFCDTIFQIENTTISPKYKYVFSERMQDVPRNVFDNSKENPNIIRGLTALYQTSNSIILEFSDNSKISDKRIARIAVFNKKNLSGKSKLFSGFRIVDVGNYRLTGVNIFSDCIISVFNGPADFKRYFEEYMINQPFKREEDKEKLKKEVSKIQEDDNPIIFKFTLKETSGL
jgi:hypothetical protein